MSDAFTVLWTHDTCRALRRTGRVGERSPVAFSGVHSSLPAWSGARAGDDVYAFHVNRYVVYVVSRMRVVDTERRDCCGNAPGTWEAPAFSGHGDWAMLGADGCGAEAVHVDSTLTVTVSRLHRAGRAVADEPGPKDSELRGIDRRGRSACSLSDAVCGARPYECRPRLDHRRRT
ncbi:hypothetical protein [Streptomyces sp. NPDC006274]|uniref:hypothetical protein n=1 Tax=unclassified Streptomyces TaxID=2593676 RepID=UPI0033A94F39